MNYKFYFLCLLLTNALCFGMKNNNNRHVSFNIETGQATTSNDTSSMIVHTARSRHRDKISRLKQANDLNEIRIINLQNDLHEALAINRRLIAINTDLCADLQASNNKLHKKLQDSSSLNLLLGTVVTSALIYTWLSWSDCNKTA